MVLGLQQILLEAEITQIEDLDLATSKENKCQFCIKKANIATYFDMGKLTYDMDFHHC